MANPANQKQITRQKIFQYIYHAAAPVSKPQIASDLDLSLPTVYRNIAELMEEGLIVYGEMQKSTGGRPPVAYVANRDYCFVVTAAVSSNKIRLYAANALMEEIGYKQVPLHSLDSVEIGQQIAKELPEFIREKELDVEKMVRIGITIPGIIDRENDLILFSPTLKMKNVRLSSMLDQIPTDVPIVIENDSTSAGYAEKFSLPVRERSRTFAYLFLEYGVGGAIFFEGRPYHGVHHRSGEFGHAKVGNRGLKCSCGKEDCLEAYIGAGRFSKNLGITIEEFMRELADGNEEYKAMWLDGIRHLAVGINSIRMAFDCDIVLGGFMTEYLEPYMDFLKQELIRQNSFEDEEEYVYISSFAKRAGIIGLSHYMLAEYLENV